LLIHVIYVSLGGFIGAALRYLTSGVIGRFMPQTSFPYGTFVVNILGCLLIGVLAGVAESREIFTTTSRAFLLTGILGAFTTFSTFSYETMGLFQSGQTSPAFANLALQVVLGLAAVWVGVQFTRFV
jgi:CrcB protein